MAEEAVEKPKRGRRVQVAEEIRKAREERLKVIPKKYQKIFERAWTGKSRKAAVRAQCIECMGFSIKGIKECSSMACSLYGYRPAFAEDGTVKEEPGETEAKGD
jgi:hypothetical protein